MGIEIGTQHTPLQFENPYYMDPAKRKGIPSDSTVIHGDPPVESLAFVGPIHDYNKHMGGVDGNAQMQSYYSPDIKTRIYWWTVWDTVLNAIIVNSYIHYTLKNPDPKKRMNHLQFRQSIQLSCMRNQTGVTTRHVEFDINPRPSHDLPEHRRKTLTSRIRCHSCTLSKRPTKHRKALSDISGNEPRKRSRAPRIAYGCTAKTCEGKAFCLKGPCWEERHRILNLGNGQGGEYTEFWDSPVEEPDT